MVGRTFYPLKLCIFQERLNVTSALSNAHIPCLIWGTDAIDFIHRPSKPTGRFDAHLHLLLADANIQSGAEAIVTTLPDIQPFTTKGTYDCHDLIFDALEPPSFPHSICLEVTRPRLDGILQNIFLHPQSQFYFDIEDHTRSVPLRSFPEGTRLPTVAAFFDSLIEVHSDPPTGCDLWTLDHLLRYWLLFLVPGIQPLLPNGELKPRLLSIMESLKPENRPYFEAMVKEFEIYSDETLTTTRKRRKEILHELGCVFFFPSPVIFTSSLGAQIPLTCYFCSRHKEAERPIPVPLRVRAGDEKYEFVPAASSPKFHRGKRVFPTLGTMSKPIQGYV